MSLTLAWHHRPRQWHALLMVFAMLMSLWHLTSHDLDLAHSDSDEQCEVCRLNHLPAVSSDTPPPIPITRHASLTTRVAIYQTDQRLVRSFIARAPPVLDQII